MGKPNVDVIIGAHQNDSTYKKVVLKGGMPFAHQLADGNCIYVVKYDFDLGGEEVTIPANSILEFDGGSLKNGSLVLNETILEGNVIIDKDVVVSGTCGNDVITPKMFGADGDGVSDDTNAFANIERLTDINRHTGIYVPTGHYIVKKIVVFEGDITMYGDGDTSIIEFKNDGRTSDYYFYVGSEFNKDKSPYFTRLSLASDIHYADTAITLAASASLKKDDVIAIVDNTPYSWIPSRDYYIKGEFMQVDHDVDGTVIDLRSPVYDNYTINENLVVSKIKMVHVNVHDLNLKFEYVRNRGGLIAIRCIDSRIDNVTADGVHKANISMSQALNSVISNCKVSTTTPFSGNNYGIGCSNSQSVVISNCIARTTRHGITIGGENNNNANIVCREILITGCICGVVSNTHASTIDMHTNTEKCTITGCVTYGGITASGKNNVVSDNSIIISISDPITHPLACTEPVESVIFSGNSIYYDNNTGTAIFYFAGSAVSGPSAKFVVTNNTVLRRARSGSGELYIIQYSAGADGYSVAEGYKMKNELYFANNTIRYMGDTSDGIRDTEAYIYLRNIYKAVFTNNNLEAVGRFKTINVERLEFLGNNIELYGDNTSIATENPNSSIILKSNNIKVASDSNKTFTINNNISANISDNTIGFKPDKFILNNCGDVVLSNNKGSSIDTSTCSSVAKYVIQEEDPLWYFNTYGTSAQRPQFGEHSGIAAGFAYFDTSLGVTVYWNGSEWVSMYGDDAGTYPVDGVSYYLTLNRLFNPDYVPLGFKYFCKDLSKFAFFGKIVNESALANITCTVGSPRYVVVENNHVPGKRYALRTNVPKIKVYLAANSNPSESERQLIIDTDKKMYSYTEFKGYDNTQWPYYYIEWGGTDIGTARVLVGEIDCRWFDADGTVLIYDRDGQGGYTYTNKQGSWANRPSVENNNIYNGFEYYDTTHKKPIYWNGTKWIDSNNWSPATSKGTTDERPVDLNYNDIGFAYYDTTLKKTIYATGITAGDPPVITWRESDGAIAGVKRSGTFDEKPVSSDIYNGFEYFATDLGTALVWTGSNWVSADGYSTSKSGTTAQRPSGEDIYVGFEYLDTDLDKLITAKAIDGSDVSWIESDSAAAGVRRKGTTAQRPESEDIYESFKYQDTTIEKAISWDGEKWIEEDGATAGVKRRGTTAERPDAADIYVGFVYYDTDLNMPIYAYLVDTDNDHVYWTDFLGVNPSVSHIGTYVQKPSGADVYIGFLYYATDLYRNIVWRGDKWTNVDGTDISFYPTVGNSKTLVDEDVFDYKDVPVNFEFYAADLGKTLHFGKIVNEDSAYSIPTDTKVLLIQNPFQDFKRYTFRASNKHVKLYMTNSATPAPEDLILMASSDSYSEYIDFVAFGIVRDYTYIYLVDEREGENLEASKVWFSLVDTRWFEEDGVVAVYEDENYNVFYTRRSGTFANKPTVADNAVYVGFRYFCTDKQTTEGATNGIEIIHKGSDVWVDALGRVVE